MPNYLIATVTRVSSQERNGKNQPEFGRGCQIDIASTRFVLITAFCGETSSFPNKKKEIK
jgi:hypothetical protein